jgi:hypothetical protein
VPALTIKPRVESDDRSVGSTASRYLGRLFQDGADDESRRGASVGLPQEQPPGLIDKPLPAIFESRDFLSLYTKRSVRQ